MRTVIIVVAALGLSGCGIADHFEAESRMDASHDAYRKCVTEHTDDVAKCNDLQRIYEQDRQAFRNASSVFDGE